MNVLMRRYMWMLWWNRWLSYEARIAIYTAFGVTDGLKVIQATNEYLIGLDASKATALEAFINEDPMVVCSLGLVVPGVTMPIRWLVGDGASWIDSEYIINSYTWFKGRFVTTRRDAPRISGALGLGSSITLQIGNTSSLKLYAGFGAPQIGSDIVVNRIYDFSITPTNTSVTWNGGSFTHSYSRPSVTGNTSLGLFARNRGASGPDCYCYWKSPFFEYGDNSESHKLVPFVSQIRNGMVDLVNMVFHPNKGTGHFTDAYTLQDGETPWSPINANN